jgi:hypothetical protein
MLAFWSGLFIVLHEGLLGLVINGAILIATAVL